ncbi:MAG: plasmid pRiA4b ORF-3 family protein, partial [Steroidobacteraceae bacterium]
ASKTIYELYLELEDIKPLIWRWLLVPASITLPKLHDLLQLAMGWTNSHLHSFTFGKKTFGMADVDDFGKLDMLDERKQTLEAALGHSAREFIYEYDFGDSWRCRIAVKPLSRANLDWSYPLCTGGARAAPPDDVGGSTGYEDFLAAIKDPKHEEHENMLIWIGGAFDPEGFDLNAINRILRFGPPPATQTPRASVQRVKSPGRYGNPG